MSASPLLNPEKPLRVCVTGGAGQIAYALMSSLCTGAVFGAKQPLVLILLDIDVPAVLERLEAVAMELNDCAYPLLTDIVCTANLETAFTNVDAVIFLGAFPRKAGMERKDLLEKNAGIFKEQGAALDKFAARHVKCLVVGNPANTNCATLIASAPSLAPSNFSALTRLDQNRATSQIASKVNTSCASVQNVVIWGNHSSTQCPDVTIATVNGKRARDVVGDDEWLNKAFIPTVQTRGAAVIKKRGASSAMSAANAVADHMRDWFQGTEEGRLVSMAVPSDGSYNIPKGLVFSFPVSCSGGDVSIKQDVVIDADLQARLTATKDELLQEQSIAFKLLGITPKM